MTPLPDNPEQLAIEIKRWASELGFQQTGIADIDLSEAGKHLERWVAAGYHGEMDYMTRHGEKRFRPDLLQPGTVRAICVRMDYLPPEDRPPEELLGEDTRGYVARYTLGRDYHKILRNRLQKLADRITSAVGKHGYRVFVDSGPVMEKPLAEKAGLGWIGKHSNLINSEAGSWFLLGEILTDLPLPVDEPASAHCGTCSACIDVCPTGAIVEPFVVDGRRCISYLTIELKGAIPKELRAPMGNRIFGCDDCQLFCPWNKFARPTTEDDFLPRHGLDNEGLCSLFNWSENEWDEKTRGSAIRRAGYEGWLRNVAVALGNAGPDPEIDSALESRRAHSSPVVREHVEWAIARRAGISD